MHISNTHLKLSRVVAAIAKSLGLSLLIGKFTPKASLEALTLETPSAVAVLARTTARLGNCLMIAVGKKLTRMACSH